MVSYKQLGLVNTREMFRKAMAGKYAIPAYNFNNMEQLQAIIQGCITSRSSITSAPPGWFPRAWRSPPWWKISRSGPRAR